MKIFLDTADRKAIKKWVPTNILDGITSNPSLLSKEQGNPADIIKEICSLVPDGDVSVEVTEKNPKDVYEQAKKIAALSDNITVKIPCHIDYYPTISRLVSEDIPINVTLVFTLFQGLSMSKLGARYISPFIGRLDDVESDGMELIHQLRHMIDLYGFETQILAASIRHVQHLHDVIEAGSDVATVPVSVLEKAVQHPLTDQGIERFDVDWKKVGVAEFP